MRDTAAEARRWTSQAHYAVDLLIGEAWGSGWTEAEDGEPDDPTTLRLAARALEHLRQAQRLLDTLNR